MQSASEVGEIGTIATAQLLGGLSGLLVSEGLARVVREIMGGEGIGVGAPSPPPASQPAQAGHAGARADGAPASAPGEGEMLAGMSAKAMKELVAQGVVGRILALNSLNTYLSLAAAEQLRRLGTQLVTAEQPPPPAPSAPQIPQSQPQAPQAYQTAPYQAAAYQVVPYPPPYAPPQAPPFYWGYPPPGWTAGRPPYR
jgi:hypothetical protein